MKTFNNFAEEMEASLVRTITDLLEEQDGDQLFHIGLHGGSTVYKTKAKNRTHAIAKVAGSLGVKPSGYFKHIRKPSPSQQSFAQHVD